MSDTGSERSTIIVGLSGGVDSAVAAHLLGQQGHRVEALFMRNWNDPEDPGRCSVQDDLDSARAVADRLGLRLHHVDFSATYWHRVFEHFVAEYERGRTPNPDVLCNREIKFRAFLDHALSLGADAVATGHYARTGPDEQGDTRLLRGRDPAKDQSYFLHAIDASALPRVRFPLGDLTKDEVRRIAREIGLPNHARPDSTGICFIGERRFDEFLARYAAARPGPMMTPDGTHLGEHKGLMHYTIGQRQGLGIGGGHGEPGKSWYVLAKDLRANRLYVGQGHDHPWLLANGLRTERPHWLGPEPRLPARLEAQVRYRQAPVPCRLARGLDGGLEVTFDEPVRAVTPGQSLVVYDGDCCLGGAVIAAPRPHPLRMAPAAAVAS